MPETNVKLVEKLVEEGIINTEKVKEAFLKIKREDFVPEKLEEYSYLDKPLSIGSGQTISAPHMVAMMTEYLKLEKNSKVMEIGTGSGYQAAIISHIIGEGKLHTIEKIEELYKQSKEKLKPYKNIKVYKGDGSLGIPQAAPFDRIISTCGAPEIPNSWGKQLKENGIIVAPVGGKRHQKLKRYEKRKGELKEEDLNTPCAFVPMKGKNGF